MTATTAQGRVLPLDGLRTLAILAVMAYHLHLPGFTGGFLGVQVFFVLSGYLITTLLLRERDRTGRIRLPRFWGRRVLRLYPALVAMVVVGALLWPWVGDYKGATLGVGEAAGISLTYTGNLFRAFWSTSQGVFAQTWSLAMEEQFYLLWPLVLVGLFAIRPRRTLVVAGIGAAVVASAAAGWVLFADPSGGSTADVYFSPVTGVAPLATGCALAIALRSARVRAVAAGPVGHVATWTGLAAVAAGVVWMDGDWTHHAWTFGIVLPAAGLASALLIGGLVSVRSLPAAALSWTPVSWFGRRVSYAAYLWHVLVFAMLEPFVHGTWGKVALLAIALVVATGAAFAVEWPVERVRARLASARAERDRGAPPEHEAIPAEHPSPARI
jgi:peptidoglycan/LPS O-acetylase OafA/YrhL